MMPTTRPSPIPSGALASPTQVAFDDIPRTSWDRLLGLTQAATPFSRWTFHRAWWDAYGDEAEPHYLIIGERQDGSPVAIVPLMARADGPTARALYFAATYHADYATVLADADDLPVVVEVLLRHVQRELGPGASIDRVDLRRLRATDPFLETLIESLSEWQTSTGWSVTSELEDVCPVVSLPDAWDTLLSGMSKKARHEVRRKLRRAQDRGPLMLRYLPLDLAAAERFIRLHQARWGSAGLFADTDAGERSRAFLRRLVELEAAEGDDARFHIGEVTVGDRAIYILAGFAADGVCYFYNAGMDPGALELSPGVVGTAMYLRDRVRRQEVRFDFLRGDEDYKYEWGAVDEAIHRVIIERTHR